MESSDDTDARPADSFSTRLQELRKSLPSVEQISSQRELDNLIQKIEPFQEDPQLLDPDLRNFITILTEKFLNHLHDSVVLGRIGTILYNFCKVRGEKVVVGLLKNEPKWIEPLLALFSAQPDMIWQQSYILLLWLSHLMLSPFDLASISSYEPGNTETEIRLQSNTPSIAIQVLHVGLKCLRAASIEQKAAASLLVRLCIRQDMLNLGILKSLCEWANSELRKVVEEGETRLGLGLLTFLSKLVASADQQDLGVFLSVIYELSQRVTDDDTFEAMRTSAIAKKLVIKIRRDTVMHCLRQNVAVLDTDTVIQEVIGSYIELLADPDTPVRLSASKAISLVTLKLDEPEMAEEILEAVITSFDEDLISGSLWAANSAKWHGLTFTLAFFIKNGAVSVTQLPAILTRLLAALHFEQRSTNGKSVGANVRDAANLGLWCMARRFTTEQLQSFDTQKLKQAQGLPDGEGESSTQEVGNQVGIIQHIACNLLQSACFDPDGNVRRGSSAALQELIGRHPNVVHEGISLVQIVDFQSVGLHSRAATTVADAVTKTHSLYIRPLAETLIQWRGLAAADLTFRSDAALGAGKVCFCSYKTQESTLNFEALRSAGPITADLIHNIRRAITGLQARQYEEQHGYLLALSWILSSINCQIKNRFQRTKNSSTQDAEGFPDPGEDDDFSQALSHIYQAIALGNTSQKQQSGFLDFPELVFLLSDSFKIKSQRAYTVAAAALRLLGQLADYYSINRHHRVDDADSSQWSYEKHASLFAKCLSPRDEMVLEQIPEAVRLTTQVLEDTERRELVRSWLYDLLPENKKAGISSHGRLLAIGAAFSELLPEDGENSTHNLILKCLLDTYMAVDVELKVVILRSIGLVLERFDQSNNVRDGKDQYLGTINILLLFGLHDYTINERGDVGSLVRLAALNALAAGWKNGLLLGDELDGLQDQSKHLPALMLHAYSTDCSNSTPLIEHLKASVLRLSLEKLDKVRESAVRVWQLAHFGTDLLTTNFEHVTRSKRTGLYEIDPDIKCVLEHGLPMKKPHPAPTDFSSPSYFGWILPHICSPHIKQHLRERALEGLCSVSGGLSGQVLINSRTAIHEFLSTTASEEQVSAFVTILRSVININTKTLNDQRLTPILELTAWTLDMRLLQRLGSTFRWAPFLSTIQKSHYLSKNPVKLQIAVDVYRGLAEIPEIRTEVLKKVVSMLLSPFPGVRIAAAETLVVVCDEEGTVYSIMWEVDWMKGWRDLKVKVEEIRKVVLGVDCGKGGVGG